MGHKNKKDKSEKDNSNNPKLRVKFDDLSGGFAPPVGPAPVSHYKGKPFTGIAEIYYDSGQLETEVNFKNGKREGLFKTYYESGELMKEGNWKNGKVEGGDYYLGLSIEKKKSQKNVITKKLKIIGNSKIISAYRIDSYRQVLEFNSDDKEPYVYYEHHEIRGDDDIDLSELGYESKEEYLDNWGDEQSYLEDIHDSANINLDDGSDVEEFDYDLDYDSSTAYHEDFNCYFSYDDAKKAFDNLVEQSRNFYKNK